MLRWTDCSIQKNLISQCSFR